MGEDDETMSPPINNPTPVAEPTTTSFAGAILLVTKNKKIRRLEWENKEDFGYLDGTDGFLKIRRDGKDYIWKVNDGDILGEDWIVLPGEES